MSRFVDAIDDDDTSIVGFVFEHDTEDYALWLTDAISKEDQRKIWEILQKYDTTGSSVRNVYEQLVNL